MQVVNQRNKQEAVRSAAPAKTTAPAAAPKIEEKVLTKQPVEEPSKKKFSLEDEWDVAPKDAKANNKKADVIIDDYEDNWDISDQED